MKHKEHKVKTVSALKWNALNQFITQIITFGIGILLMRLLEPSEFGLLGMVTVFSGFMNVFNNFGLTTSLIQKKQLEEDDKSTVFYANLLIGMILTVLLFFGSVYIAEFYKTPELIKIAKYISFLFSIQALGMVHSALLRKHLNYKYFFYANLITAILSGALAAYLALHDYGVWALVYQHLARASVATILLWFLVSWYPKFVFSFTILKEHLKFSVPLFGTNALNYWTRNADNLLIGKVLGSAALGLYSKAYALMMLPLTQISSVISSVMMPSFSLIQDDKERVKIIYLKISRVIAFITFPMMGILFVAAQPLVNFAFGDKWTGIISLLKVFAFVGAIQSIFTLNGNIFISQGKTKLQFQLKVFTSIFVIFCLIVGIQYGIEGVAKAYLIAITVPLIPNLYFIGSIINSSIYEILNNLKLHTFSFIVLVLLCSLLYTQVESLIDIYQILIISSVFCLGWLILFRVLDKKLLSEIFNLLKVIKNK